MPVYDKASFMDRLGIVSYTLNPMESSKTVRSKNGQLWRASSGVRLWQGSITCRDHKFDNQRPIEAMLINMQNPGNYFLFSPKKGSRPITPGLVGTPVVDGPQTAGYTLRLRGMTPNFKLSCGDYFSYLHNEVHRFYQIAEDATVNASGVVTIRVNMPIYPGVLPVSGTGIRFQNPIMTAEVVPGSVSFGTVGIDRQSGISFQFTQSVRIS